MQQIFQTFGNKPVVGDWGIEIEAEGKELHEALPRSYWLSEDDPSLRGRFPETRHEWKLAKPINIREVGAALDQLIGWQKDAQFKFSFRTSVHVHMNVSELTRN